MLCFASLSGGRSNRGPTVIHAARCFRCLHIARCTIPRLDNWQRAAVTPSGEAALWIAKGVGDPLRNLCGVLASTETRGGGDTPPFMFTCPAVRTQISRLLLRHFAFLSCTLHPPNRGTSCRTRIRKGHRLKLPAVPMRWPRIPRDVR